VQVAREVHDFALTTAEMSKTVMLLRLRFFVIALGLLRLENSLLQESEAFTPFRNKCSCSRLRTPIFNGTSMKNAFQKFMAIAAVYVVCITAAQAQAPAGPNRPAAVPLDYVITPFGYFHPSSLACRTLALLRPPFFNLSWGGMPISNQRGASQVGIAA
jgi:hypothetical protein